MKKLIFSIAISITASASAQKLYNNLPVIKTINQKADYRIGNDWTRNSWTITPELNPDVMQVYCSGESVPFGFYTDVDSVVFDLHNNQAMQFYVLTKEGKYALTEIKAIPFNSISFDDKKREATYKFTYETNRNNEYLAKLRTLYNLENLVAGAKDEKDKALKVLNWVHNQWKHNGDNEPTKRDAISILQEAKEGKNFRCVEYGIVTTSCLNALGMPARVVGLKTKDVETTEYGAGHVLLEVFLKDYNKWVLMDGQFDVMPVLNNVPLNAVEFQKAIVNNYDKLELHGFSGTNKRSYINWVFPYLYYIDARFNNSDNGSATVSNTADKKNLMLVPIGAKEPTVFQKKNPITYCSYTNSLADFYAPPSF